MSYDQCRELGCKNVASAVVKTADGEREPVCYRHEGRGTVVLREGFVKMPDGETWLTLLPVEEKRP